MGGVMPPATLTEVVRRLDEVVRQLDRLTDTLEQKYVRQDVAEAESKATNVLLDGLEKEVHGVGQRIDKMEQDATANRRLIIASFVYPLAVGVIVALLVFALHR